MDAIIVGAGPSGLMTAVELIRHGLTCRIIDKAPAPCEQSRAIGIQPRTLEIFHHIGILEACLNKGLKISHFVPSSHDRQLADLSFELVDSPFKFLLSLEQSQLELIFIEHLQNLGCTVEREVEMLSFEQRSDHVELILNHHRTATIEHMKADWLLGCDGAHSRVRKGLNLTFEGVSLPENLSLADLEIEWKFPHDCARAFLNEKGILAAFPMKGKNKFRIIFQLPRCRKLLKNSKALIHGQISPSFIEPPTVEEVRNFIHQYADPQAKIIQAIWMANFFINSRMVNQYRENRAFLIGDAAHIHSPVGAQGMNTGIQDAFNLGWKLALVHKGNANPGLLDSYQDERHDFGKKLLYATEHGTSLILLRSSPLVFLRNWLMRIATSFKTVRKRIVNTIGQIAIQYPLSNWILQIGRTTKFPSGKRAPDVIIERDDYSLFSKWKGSTKFHLLIVDLTYTQGKTVKEHYEKNPFLDVFLIGKREDIQGQVEAHYGDKTIYLVRPDGYIAFCAAIQNTQQLDEYLERLFKT